MLCASLGAWSCSSEAAPNPITEPNPNASGDVTVENFGAFGDDTLDDTRGIEAAIASLPSTGGVVLIPAGVYRISAAHTNPYRAVDISGRYGVTIRGEGVGLTVLRMVPGSYQGTISAVWIQDSRAVTVRDLTLDANRDEVFYADEQSHVVSVVSSSDVTIDAVGLVNSAGDGLRLLGAPVPGTPWTDGVRVEDSTFDDIWRNGISIQRSVRNVVIARNTFTRVTDQSISSEPSGVGGPSDLIIEDNYIHHSTGNWAVALAGINTTDVLQRVQFRRNHIVDGAAYFLQTSGVTLLENTILGDIRHPPLRLQDVDSAIVLENELTAVNEGPEGALQIVNDNGNFPSSVLLEANEIRVGAGMTGVYVRDAMAGVTIRGNQIRGQNAGKGILVENVLATGTTRTDFVIEQNVIANFTFGIHLSTRADLFSGLMVKGNEIDHDQAKPAKAIGIALVGFPSVADVVMTSNVFGLGVTRTICIISGNESC